MFRAEKKDKYKVSFLIVLTVVVLCSCVLVGSVLAWLTRTYTYSDDDNLIGSVELAIFADGVEVTGTTSVIEGKTTWVCNTPYEITGNSTLRNNINLKIRNTGTIDAIVRATINIYYIDDYDNSATDTDKRPLIIASTTPTAKGTANLDTSNWVYDFPSSTVACGYMFYNNKLSPYVLREPGDLDGVAQSTVPANEVSIIDQILLSESQKDVTIYIDLTVEAVAYAGNIYKKMENNQTTSADIPVHALPFGLKDELPESWTAWR